MTLKIRYSVVSVNNYGNTTNTVITGSYAEKLADAHYHELTRDEKTKYAVELVFKDDDKQGNVRAEFHRKPPMIPETKKEDIWPVYTRHQATVHTRRLDDGKWYWYRTLNDKWGPYETEHDAVDRIQELDQNMVNNDDRSGREIFWSVLEEKSDRWGRAVPDSIRMTGPVGAMRPKR